MKENRSITMVEDLKRIAMSSDMTIYYKNFSNDETSLFEPIITEEEEKCYETNNSVLAFVDNKTLYFLPYFAKALNILIDNGFVNKHIYVPFSSGRERPLSHKWDYLVTYAKEERAKDFKADCERFCDKHHIGTISENLLDSCLKLPDSGISLHHMYWDQIVFPELCGCLDSTATEKIGHYNTNNGVCIFVYRDGNTYVTRNIDVVYALKENGYKEYGFFVPFSNGEFIQDPVYAQKWNIIKQK